MLNGGFLGNRDERTGDQERLFADLRHPVGENESSCIAIHEDDPSKLWPTPTKDDSLVINMGESFVILSNESRANSQEAEELRNESRRDVQNQYEKKLKAAIDMIEETTEDISRAEKIGFREQEGRGRAHGVKSEIGSGMEILEREYLALHAKYEEALAIYAELKDKYKKLEGLYFKQLEKIKKQEDKHEMQLNTIKKGMEEKILRQQIEYEEQLQSTIKEKDNKIAQISRDYQKLLDKTKAQNLLRKAME